MGLCFSWQLSLTFSLVSSLELTKHACTGVQSCPLGVHVPFQSLVLPCRAGMWCSPSACLCEAELSENRSELLRALGWEAETAKPVEELLTAKYATVLSSWGFKQTQSSSRRGNWQHSRRSSEVSGSSYSELWTVPLHKHQKAGCDSWEETFHCLPRIVCSKLLQRLTARQVKSLKTANWNDKLRKAMGILYAYCQFDQFNNDEAHFECMCELVSWGE